MANHSEIRDSGTFFEIVPIARKIIVPTAYKVVGTVGDHLSEQLTFKCPKTIDGHDITGCARHYLTWKNVNGDIGHDNLTIADSDEEYIYFTWIIRDGLSVATGLISFSIHFEDVDASDKIIYRWSTALCTECEILDSISAVLGAYEAVYVVGDTLVFEDYIPVKDGVLTLETNGLIPEGTKKIIANGEYDVGKYAQVNVSVDKPSGTKAITTNGTHDVTNYALADVEIPFEAPAITISDQGVVTAEANGVTSEFELDAPTVTVTNSGYAKATSHGKETTLFLGKPLINVLDSGSVKAIANNLVESVKLSAEHDPHFIPANIKKDVNIFGVTGSYDPLPLVSGIITDNSITDNIDVGIVVYYSGYSKTLGESYGVIKDNWYSFNNRASLNTKFVKDLPIIIMPSLGASYPMVGTQQAGFTIELLGDVELVASACDGSLFVVRPTGDNFEVRVPMTPAVG